MDWTITVDTLVLVGTLIATLGTLIATLVIAHRNHRFNTRNKNYSDFFQLLNHKENLLLEKNIYIKNLNIDDEDNEREYNEARVISIVTKNLMDIGKEYLKNNESVSQEALNKRLNGRYLKAAEETRSDYSHKGIISGKHYSYHKIILNHINSVKFNNTKKELINLYLESLSVREKIYYLINDSEISQEHINLFFQVKDGAPLNKLDDELNNTIK